MSTQSHAPVGQMVGAALVTSRPCGHVTEVEIRCRAIDIPEADSLLQHLLDLAHRADGFILLRIEEVRDYASAWINAMITLAEHCSGLGGRLVVCGVEARVRKVIRETGLSRRLIVADGEQDARRILGLAPVTGVKLLVAKLLSIPVPATAVEPRRHAA